MVMMVIATVLMGIMGVISARRCFEALVGAEILVQMMKTGGPVHCANEETRDLRLEFYIDTVFARARDINREPFATPGDNIVASYLRRCWSTWRKLRRCTQRQRDASSNP